MSNDALVDGMCFVFGDSELRTCVPLSDFVQYIQGTCAEYLGHAVQVQEDVLNLHLSTLVVGGRFECNIAFAKVFLLSDMRGVLGAPLSMMLCRRMHDYSWALPERSLTCDSALIADLVVDAVAVRRELLFARASIASGGSLYTEEVGDSLCIVSRPTPTLRRSSATGVARGRRSIDEHNQNQWEQLRVLMSKLVLEGHVSSNHTQNVARTGYESGTFATTGHIERITATLCSNSAVRRALLELDKAVDLFTAASFDEEQRYSLLLLDTRVLTTSSGVVGPSLALARSCERPG